MLRLIIYLRKISVSNLTFVAFLSSEGVVAHAAAGVDVTLWGHRADCTATTLLQAPETEYYPLMILTLTVKLHADIKHQAVVFSTGAKQFLSLFFKADSSHKSKRSFSRCKMECIQIRVLLAVSEVT